MTFKVPYTLLNIETPPQFSNDLTAVTTAFVQRALGSAALSRFVSTNTTLTAADAGTLLVANATLNFTLPDRSSVPAGTRFEFRNFVGTPSTILRVGSDTFNVGNSSVATSVTLASGSYIAIIADADPTKWNTSGESTLSQEAQFSGSNTSSGYVKLASGVIVQWGTGVSSGTASFNGTVTFPIAFPTAGMNGYSVISGSGSLGVYTTQIGAISTTQLQITTVLGTAVTGSLNFRWVAFGY